MYHWNAAAVNVQKQLQLWFVLFSMHKCVHAGRSGMEDGGGTILCIRHPWWKLKCAKCLLLTSFQLYIHRIPILELSLEKSTGCTWRLVVSRREVCTYPCLFVESWKTAFCYIIHTIKATEKVELCVPCLLLKGYETKEIVCSSPQMCFGMRIYGYHKLLWPPPSLPVASICCRRSLYLLVC